MMTYKQMASLVMVAAAAAFAKFDEDFERRLRFARHRLRKRGRRPRRCLPNGRSMVAAGKDTPDRHIHPRMQRPSYLRCLRAS